MSVWLASVLSPSPSSLCRGEAIQMHLGRLHVEVRPLRRADAALQEAHGGEALQVRRLRPQLLQVRPPGPAPAETHAGVTRYTERERERSMEQTHMNTHTHTHTLTHTQTEAVVGAGSPYECFSAGLDAHTHTHMHTHTHARTHTHYHPSPGKEAAGCTGGALNRVTSGPPLGWKERTAAGSVVVILWRTTGNCLHSTACTCFTLTFKEELALFIRTKKQNIYIYIYIYRYIYIQGQQSPFFLIFVVVGILLFFIAAYSSTRNVNDPRPRAAEWISCVSTKKKFRPSWSYRLYCRDQQRAPFHHRWFPFACRSLLSPPPTQPTHPPPSP